MDYTACFKKQTTLFKNKWPAFAEKVIKYAEARKNSGFSPSDSLIKKIFENNVTAFTEAFTHQGQN